jgi:hypothetical protein
VSALFPRWTNTVLRLAIAVILIGATAAICAPMIYIRTPYAASEHAAIEQPVEFDHRHHVRDDGIDCVYCHETVETSAFAGIPATARCMGCHVQVWPDSPRLAPVRASWLTGQPIHWKRINAVPGYVYFHHGVHIQAGIQCTACHGDVTQMPRVERVHDLSMKFCLDCHRAKSGGRQIGPLTTCTTCHR